MSDPAEVAAARFAAKLNCAQAVFSAFAAELGLDEETALRIASPLGGGIGRSGNVCGAVIGGLMVLGLARGSSMPEGKESSYLLAQEFMRRFREEHGALSCNDLIGADISLPAGREAARARGRFQQVCPPLIRSAAAIVTTILAAPPPPLKEIIE
jgi:C_GCAxxG_C_C family probable redox protein